MIAVIRPRAVMPSSFAVVVVVPVVVVIVVVVGIKYSRVLTVLKHITKCLWKPQSASRRNELIETIRPEILPKPTYISSIGNRLSAVL